MIEGLAILASIANNTSPWRNLLSRCQTHLFERSASDTMLEFNAVANLATANGTNIYGGSCTGPPIKTADFSGQNQTLGIGALISSINLETASNSSSTTSTTASTSTSTTTTASPSESSAPPLHKSVELGAILGGALGGVGFGIIMLTILCFVRGQRRSSRTAGKRSGTSITPEPFLACGMTIFTRE
ncbi:hypothetical protein B0H19DRAFT_1235543 [Mycena capillaripes]|nr:hypothetical protein B0H19DRAFT_1235543 [Mycena capillaripes]